MKVRIGPGPTPWYAVAFALCIVAIVAAGTSLKVLTWFLVRPSPVPTAARAGPAGDDALAVLAEFGPPESDRVTEIEGQERATPMRLFTYASRHVRVIFMARRAGSPPRSVWKLAGVLDPDTNHMLEGEEAVKRLEARR